MMTETSESAEEFFDATCDYKNTMNPESPIWQYDIEEDGATVDVIRANRRYWASIDREVGSTQFKFGVTVSVPKAETLADLTDLVRLFGGNPETIEKMRGLLGERATR